MISNQKSNLYIKKACEVAGIDEPVTRTKYRGAERIEENGPKYNFISFHTGRRNFCTINLNNKISPEIIMKVTGHKSYKVFSKYIGISSREVADELTRAWK